MMQDGVKTSVRERMVSVLEQTLAPNPLSQSVSDDTAFSDIGLTSFDVVSLMLFTESEFDISIPQDEIVPENFRSLATVIGLLSRLGVPA